jgi:hypothetical protein
VNKADGGRREREGVLGRRRGRRGADFGSGRDGNALEQELVLVLRIVERLRSMRNVQSQRMSHMESAGTFLIDLTIWPMTMARSMEVVWRRSLRRARRERFWS